MRWGETPSARGDANESAVADLGSCAEDTGLADFDTARLEHFDASSGAGRVDAQHGVGAGPLQRPCGGGRHAPHDRRAAGAVGAGMQRAAGPDPRGCRQGRGRAENAAVAIAVPHLQWHDRRWRGQQSCHFAGDAGASARRRDGDVRAIGWHASQRARSDRGCAEPEITKWRRDCRCRRGIAAATPPARL